MDTEAVADALAAVLDEIHSGAIEATVAQRAYIAGALDSLRAISAT